MRTGNACKGIFRGITGVRFNSSFDQLANAFKQNQGKDSGNNNTNKNNSAISDIDSLLSSTFDPQSNSKFNEKSQDYLLQNSLKHPRDVAKSIRVTGPFAGRTVDVHYGNLGRALAALNSIIRNNRVRYLQKVQTRFIRPAKYKKQKKREWWRRKFSLGFKELMAEVRDAKRRGY